jgi:hypothetical protein
MRDVRQADDDVTVMMSVARRWCVRVEERSEGDIVRRARLGEASPAPPSRDADGNGRRASGETRGRRRSLDSVMRSTNAPGGNKRAGVRETRAAAWRGTHLPGRLRVQPVHQAEHVRARVC